MKTGAIIQARLGSTRLPGKVLKEVLGRPLLVYLFERLKGVKNVDEIIVATTEREENRAIIDLAAKEGVATFAGSETDVLDRYYRAAQAHHLDHIVRITADCPLIEEAKEAGRPPEPSADLKKRA